MNEMIRNGGTKGVIGMFTTVAASAGNPRSLLISTLFWHLTPAPSGKNMGSGGRSTPEESLSLGLGINYFLFKTNNYLFNSRYYKWSVIMY